MRVSPKQICKLLLLLLVIGSALAVSTSAVLGAHDHGQNSGTCNLCLIGHLAWFQPASLGSLQPPVMREWRDVVDNPGRLPEQLQAETSSRAPPAC